MNINFIKILEVSEKNRQTGISSNENTTDFEVKHSHKFNDLYIENEF